MLNRPPQQPISITPLEGVLSKPRLDKYRTLSSTPREVMGRYRWNVAELSFGFWTSLLSSAYDQKLWN